MLLCVNQALFQYLQMLVISKLLKFPTLSQRVHFSANITTSLGVQLVASRLELESQFYLNVTPS